MQHVLILIDKASKVCGSDSALAKRLGIPRQNVYLMRKGAREISPATAAELADIAGEDARQAAIDAVIESARGTRREGVLREILGKAVAAGVAGTLVFSYGGDWKNATEKIAMNGDRGSHAIHRIYWALMKKWRFIRQKMGDFPDGNRALALRVEPAKKAKTAADCFVHTSWL